MADKESLKVQPDLTSVSVVVPVYNSETTLVELVDRLEAVLSPLAHDFEVIFVNDGSKDNSWHQISTLVEKKKFVRGINLMLNYSFAECRHIPIF